jgi:hypothetical protein
MYDAYHAYQYALDVIKDRWLEAEPIIMKDAEYAYLYAKEVIKGRWPVAEPTIQQDAEFAYYYAQRIIKGRFLAAEQTILQNAEYMQQYTDHFFPYTKVVTKRKINDDWLWEKSGAIGCFAPEECSKLKSAF